MEITEKTREELKVLICQALDEREQQAAANKYVYRRICGDFEEQLKKFDYVELNTLTDINGDQQQHDTQISCSYRIRTAVSCLLRIIYKVNATANLPAEQEDRIRHFMSSVLGLMAELRNQT